MRTIRIALAELPRMLSEILIQLIADEEDMKVVRSVDSVSELPTVSGELAADVVIVGSRSSELSASGRQLLDRSPRLKVLALAGDGRRATLWELKPYKQPIGVVSPARLLDAIRRTLPTASPPRAV